MTAASQALTVLATEPSPCFQYQPHFTKKAMEVQRGGVTCPKSHSQQASVSTKEGQRKGPFSGREGSYMEEVGRRLGRHREL